MAKVVLFGNGRGADVAHRFLLRDSEHEVIGFTVDAKYIAKPEFRGLPLVPFEEVNDHFPTDDTHMFVLLGYQEMNGLRRRKYEQSKAKGYRFISYVNSAFYRAEDLDVGENCFILDNQSISLDVKIGNNVVMWSSNHVGDLTVVEDHAWLASHVCVAANARICEQAFLGINATVGNHVRIGARGFVGAGALVTACTQPDSVTLAVSAGDAEGIPATQFMRIMMAKNQL